MARDLLTVIDRMLALIPPGDSLIPALEDVRSSTEFSAPEMMRLRWEETAEALADRFGDDPPVEDGIGGRDSGTWESQVCRIFMDKD